MKADQHNIPFALPDIGEEEIAEVVDTLKSGWLTTGPKTKQFEEDFAKKIGVKHAIAVNSATSGLHLALEAVGVGPGDKVATTCFTFTASAEVIRYLGADPVFIDVEPDTFNMDMNALEKTLQADKTIKTVMPVHIAGQACDMGTLEKLVEKYDLVVVEDAAHALPTTSQGRLIGSISDVSVFSFYVTKTLATGEGGMVTTNRDDLADRMRVMRLHGMSRDAFDRYRATDKPAWYYEIVAPGFKYNMTDIAASLGLHQLKKIDRFQQRREEIANAYSNAFADLPVQVPRVARQGDTHAWHLYILQLDLDGLTIDRDRFIELMLENKVGCSVHFIPLHMQPYWRDRYELKPDQFPVATDAYQRIVSLPIYTKMSDDDVNRVIDVVRSVLLEHAK